MAEIPNNHLGWCWNLVNNGINYQPQLVSQISAINILGFNFSPRQEALTDARHSGFRWNVASVERPVKIGFLKGPPPKKGNESSWKLPTSWIFQGQNCWLVWGRVMMKWSYQPHSLIVSLFWFFTIVTDRKFLETWHWCVISCVFPLPSNSHHRDYYNEYIFRLGDPNLSLHLPLLLWGLTTQVSLVSRCLRWSQCWNRLSLRGGISSSWLSKASVASRILQKFLLVAVKMRVYQGTKGTTDQNWLIFKVISALSPIIMEEKTWQFLKGNYYYYWMDLFFTEPWLWEEG